MSYSAQTLPRRWNSLIILLLLLRLVSRYLHSISTNSQTCR